jgi:tripartite-type tricarboxylate transporter receptor subunit TctC
VFKDGLSQEFKQPMILDYKPGGSGVIGNQYVIRNGGDGHTVAFAAATIAILPAFNKDIPYDLLKDMAPVSLMIRDVYVMVVPADFPANTFEEYIAYAKANPGKINWGTVGAGGALHLGGEWLAHAMGVKFTFVHYKGSSQAEIDLMAGRIQAVPKGMISAIPLVKSGKAKVLAILQSQRASALPGIRTVAEMGAPDYEYPSWIGIIGAGATPPAIVNKLSAALARGVKSPKSMQTWDQLGVNPVGSTPDEFRRILARETEHWKKFVTENNIRGED